MKCPLIIFSFQAWGVAPEEHEGDCLGTNCAWWDSSCDKCSILALAFQLEESVVLRRQFLELTRPPSKP